MHTTIAEVDIQVRARTQDRILIDGAAKLVAANRSQLVMRSALKEGKNVLLGQSTIYAVEQAFQEVMDWLADDAATAEAAGMQRLLESNLTWRRG